MAKLEITVTTVDGVPTEARLENPDELATSYVLDVLEQLTTTILDEALTDLGLTEDRS